jgi:hypothetical protein
MDLHITCMNKRSCFSICALNCHSHRGFGRHVAVRPHLFWSWKIFFRKTSVTPTNAEGWQPFSNCQHGMRSERWRTCLSVLKQQTPADVRAINTVTIQYCSKWWLATCLSVIPDICTNVTGGWKTNRKHGNRHCTGGTMQNATISNYGTKMKSETNPHPCDTLCQPLPWHCSQGHPGR